MSVKHLRGRIALGRMLLILIGLALPLAACGGNSVPREQIQFAEQVVAHLQARNFDAIEALIDPPMRDAELRPRLLQMASLFPNNPETRMAVVEAEVTQGPDANITRYAIELEQEFPDRWLVTQLLFERINGEPVIKGLLVTLNRASLGTINAFTFAGRPLASYLVLSWAVAAPLLILLAMTVLVRAPTSLLAKGMWALVILVGVGALTLNWTSGVMNFSPLHVQPFGTGYTSGPLTPVILTTSFPLGALLFLLARATWLRERPLPERPS